MTSEKYASGGGDENVLIILSCSSLCYKYPLKILETKNSTKSNLQSEKLILSILLFSYQISVKKTGLLGVI